MHINDYLSVAHSGSKVMADVEYEVQGETYSCGIRLFFYYLHWPISSSDEPNNFCV
jgi:hypothetical protein